MAGEVLYPRKMKSKTQSMLSHLEALESDIESAKKSLNRVSENKLILQGLAWDSVRSYMDEIQIPLMAAYSLWRIEQQNATMVYLNAAKCLPLVDSLNREMLEYQLGLYQNRLDREESRSEPKRSRIRHYKNMIREIETKLDAMDTFLSKTAGAFDEATRLQSILNRADTELTGVSYNPAMQTINYSSVSASWRLELQAAAEKELLVVEIKEDENVGEYVELLLSEKGGMYLHQMMSKDKLSDAESQAIAYALIVSGDEKLLESALRYCYRVSDVKELSVGGMVTVNVINEKSEHLESIYRSLELMTGVLFYEASISDVEAVKEAEGKMVNAMQYTQLFKTMNGLDTQMVVSSYSSIFGDKTQVKGENLITLEKNSDGSLQVKWFNYAGAGAVTLDYESQREAGVIITRPTKGATALDQATDDSFRYIRSGLSIGDYSGAVAGNVLGTATAFFIGTLPGANLISLVKGVNDAKGAYDGAVGTETIFNDGERIKDVGVVLDLFNMYYVSSIIEPEGGQSLEHQFSVYPTYRTSNDPNAPISTQECVDNFNVNFGEGGRFDAIGKEDPNSNIEYEEWGPLTIEDLNEDLPKVVDVMVKWKEICVKDGIDRDEATIPFSSGGSR